MTGVQTCALPIYRERAEGERPGPGPAKQRWEAVFRRERRPESLDRFSTAGGCPPADLAWQGENAVSVSYTHLDVYKRQGQGSETGIALIADGLNAILRPDQATTVLLETMAGKGSEVGGRFCLLYTSPPGRQAPPAAR